MKRPGFTSGNISHDCEPNRCRWETNGRQCQMRGTIGHVSEGRSDLYCPWHHGRHPKGNTLEEFDRWLNQSYPERQSSPLAYDATERTRTRYNNVWIKKSIINLWQMVNGG